MTAGNKQRFKYALFLVPVIVLAYSVKISLKPSDFTVFLEAASMISEGQSPYNEWIFVSEGNYCFYFYSPFWAVLLIPFSYLPEFVPQLLWLILSAFFLYRIWQLLKQYIAPEIIPKRLMNIVLILTVLMSVRFILYNFEMIQMTVFLLWGSLESIRLINEKRFVFGTALLAFVINVKILPIVIIPYLIYRGQLKAVVITLGFSVLFLFLPALFIGWDQNTVLLTEWFDVINPTNSEHLLEADLGPHSLTALIPTLFSETEGILPSHRNIMSLSVENAVLVMNGIRVVLIFFALYFLAWPPFKAAKSKIHDLYALSYLFLMIPLIFPHQQKYAFFCIVPAIFYTLNFLVNNYGKKEGRGKYYLIVVLFSLSFLLMTGTTDGLVGRELNQLFQHYKLITYGTLLLIPVLVLCKVRYFSKYLD